MFMTPILQTIENLRNRNKVELVHTEERFTKLMSKPSVDSIQRFNEDLVAVKMLQTKLKLNRPIYAGMVILDLAKRLMYNFYYNTLKAKYGDRVNLLFTDTDSLCISVNTDDVYEDIKELQNELDCSDYPTDHPLQALGKFKDEMSGKIIEEYVGLRSKMYSIKWPEGNVRTCKGISKNVNKVVLRHEKYKQCLINVELRKDKVSRIERNFTRYILTTLVRYHCHPLVKKDMCWMTRLIPWLMAIMPHQSNLHMFHYLFDRCYCSGNCGSLRCVAVENKLLKVFCVCLCM